LIRFLELAEKGGKSDQVLPIFAGAKSVADVRAMDDHKLFGSYLRGALKMSPALKQSMAASKYEIFGHVDEGKEKPTSSTT
jgi:hypothetical protein